MKESKKEYWQRIVIPVVLGIVGLFGLYWIYAHWSLNPYIKHRLQEVVRQESKGKMRLSVESVSTSLFNRSVTLRNPRVESLTADTSSAYLQADKLEMGGIHLLDYWWTGTMRVGRVNVIRPVLKVRWDYLQQLKKDTSLVSEVDTSFQWFIQEANIRGGTIQLLDKSGNIQLKVGRIDMSLAELRRPHAPGKTMPFSYRDFDIEIKEGGYHFQNDLYVLKVDEARCDVSNKECTSRSLRLIPQLPRHTFSRRVGHEADRVDLVIPRIRAIDLDVKQMIEGEIDMGKLLIEKADLVVFHDKARPMDTTIKQLPHVSLNELPTFVKVDTVQIEGSTISYLEQREEIAHPGRITFSDITAILQGITNKARNIERQSTVELDLQARVMQSARLKLNAWFPMNQDGRHRLRGSVDSLQMSKLNPILEPLLLVRVKSGVINSLNFDMELGPQQSAGKVKMDYSGLNIEILNKGDIGDTGHQIIASFLANALKVKSENQEPLRVGEISVRRNRKRSMFNYWWKSLAAGLKHSIGL